MSWHSCWLWPCLLLMMCLVHACRNNPVHELIDVQTGEGYVCTLDMDGVVECTGGPSPSSDYRFSAISVSARTHGCGIRSDSGALGLVTCWLGPSACKTTVRSQGPLFNMPADFYGDLVSAGDCVTCATRSYDGEIQCWGE